MSVEDHDSRRLQVSGYQLLQVSNPQNDSLFCCLHQDLEVDKESESVFHLHIRGLYIIFQMDWKHAPPYYKVHISISAFIVMSKKNIASGKKL